jgi:hypothetical protein
VAITVVALGAYLSMSGQRLPFDRPRDVSRLLIIVALPDESGAVVAQVVADVDLAKGVVATVDPATEVVIPGTSFSALRDAYPFGGGAGVARALARARSSEALPYLVITAKAAEVALVACGGIDVELREPMTVFDGERLYDWSPGRVDIDDVSELRAMLNGIAYLDERGRQDVLRQVTKGAVLWAASYPEGLPTAVRNGVVETDLTEDEAAAVAARLALVR